MKLDEYRETRPQNITSTQTLLFDIAKQIVGLRLEKGWSQTELARCVGCTQQTISLIENGQTNPKIGFLIKLAEAFDIQLSIRLIEKIDDRKD